MDRDDYVISCVNGIRRSRNKRDETSRVIQRVNNLVYTETKQRIDTEDKIMLLTHILDELISPTTKTTGVTYFEKSADNKYYLALINDAIELLKNK